MNSKLALVWLTILVPIACLFGPALVSDRSFAMRDAAHFYYPLFQWTCDEWAAGRVPLWNPYESGGVPVVADASSSVFYPGKLLFALPLDFTLQYKLYIIAHVVLAAAGVYRLARHWQASHYAAAVAAVSYAVGGNVVFQYCNVVFLVGAAWLPWGLLAADAMLVKRSWRGALALGAVLALMILGGDPQAALHTLLISAAYLCFLGRVTEKQSNDRSYRPVLVRGALFCLAAVSGFLLAAVQVLPSSESAKGSERAAYNSPRNIYEAAEFLSRGDSATARGASGPQAQSVAQGFFGRPDGSGHHERVYDFSLAPWRLVEFIWPNVSGRMFPTQRRWAAEFIREGRIWTPSLYMGLVPLLLAVGQLHWLRGEARMRWLSWTLAFFLVASFGYFGLGWLINWAGREIAALRGNAPADQAWLGNPVGGLYWLLVVLLPTYVYFRYPAKLLVIVSLAISLLAARGWDQAFRDDSPRLKCVLKWLGNASFAAAALAWIVLGLVKFDGWQTDAALGPFDLGGAKWDLLTALLQTGLVAYGALALLNRAQKEPAANWQAIAVLLTAAELTLANYWLIQSAPAELWREKPSVATTIDGNRADPPDDGAVVTPPRIYRGRFSGWRPASFAQKASERRMIELDRWERDTLFPKYQLPAGISLVESYGSLKSLDYQVLLDIAKSRGPRQADGARLPHPAVLRMLGTEQMLLPASYKPGFADRIEPAADAEATWPENATLWKVRRPGARAWIVHEVLTLPPLAHPQDIAAVEARTAEVLFAGNKARNFLETAIVEREHSITTKPRPVVADSSAADSSSDSLESCTITHYEPQRVRIEAHLVRPGLLVLSDSFAPGWTASVETFALEGSTRREVAILRTNRVLRGVELPAGKHVVEFRCEPRTIYRGAAISGLSWILICVAAAFCGRRNRKGSEA